MLFGHKMLNFDFFFNIYSWIFIFFNFEIKLQAKYEFLLVNIMVTNTSVYNLIIYTTYNTHIHIYNI